MAETRSRLRRLAINTTVLITSLVVLGVSAEIVLRFLPYQTGLNFQPVNGSQTVFRAAPNRPYTYSIRWDLALANHRKTNNDGFLNHQDYSSEGTRPLIAVVGDSYIEAAAVTYEETLFGRIAESLKGFGRVYSYGFSGAPLSQYLAWAGHARDTVRPDGLIVTVVGNDFDESLARVKRRPGFHHYEQTREESLRLVRFDYEPSPIRPIVRNSALAQYLIYNLQVMEVRAQVRTRLAAALTKDVNGYVGNASAAVGQERITVSRHVVDAFLRDLPGHAGLPPKKILIVVDAVRRAIYKPERLSKSRDSYFGKMRHYLLTSAQSGGFAVLDLEQPFRADFASNRVPFEHPLDSHWNGHAHGVIAEAIQTSDWLRLIQDGT